MKCSALSCVVAMILASGTLSAHATAQAMEPARAADAVRSDFVQAGFQVAAPSTWWTDGVTTFTVQDPSSDRIAMVLVFPTLEVAQTARQQAAARDGDSNPANQHPHLVPGYGRSEWRGNIALVQSSLSDLGRLYAAQYQDGIVTVVRTDVAADADLAMRPLEFGRDADSDLVAIITNGPRVDL